MWARINVSPYVAEGLRWRINAPGDKPLSNQGIGGSIVAFGVFCPFSTSYFPLWDLPADARP